MNQCIETAWSKVAFAALVLSCLFAPKASHADDALPAAKPVRIGFICPFTGGSQDFGNSARMGAELAVQEINEVGGYLGRRFELVSRDDKANPDEGRRIAQELVLQKQVDFTIGFCNSGVALKSLDVFQENRHLLLVPVATGTAITAKYPPRSSYVFRTSVRDAVQVEVLVDEIVKRGFRRAAIFADTTGYGEGGLKDLQARLAEKNVAVVHVARFKLGVESLVDDMKAAKAARADVILSYTVGPEQAAVARARSEVKMAAPLLGPWTMSFRSVMEKAGAAVEGAAMPQTIIQDFSHEQRTSFLARLRAFTKSREPLGSLMSAAQSYDAVHLMLSAMFQTHGNTDADALKNALENLNHSHRGVVTTYSRPFSPNDHDAITGNMLFLGVWRQGEIHFLYTDDAKRASLIQRKQ